MLSGNLSFEQLTPLEQFAKRVIGLDEKVIFKRIIDTPEIKEAIIFLNTQDQLFKKGENSLGVKLEDIGGGYASFTIERKKKLSQPTDRVTLKDTGDFYRSFKVDVTPEYFDITADPIKDDTNLTVEWGEEIIGLNEKNLQIISTAFLQEINRYLNSQLRLL